MNGETPALSHTQAASLTRSSLLANPLGSGGVV